MVLPTYLDIKEAAKRIQQKCREPVTPEWLLQHASEGKLQLFALVRDEDVCILTGAKPFGTGRMNTPERPPMSVMSHEVFGGDRFPLDALDQMIRVVHPVGSRAPLEDVWARRLVANRNADIYTVAIDGERASVISRIYSNWRLHENGHIVGSAWRWKVSISDLCFLSEAIEHLIEVNSSTAATNPKQPVAPTKTTATQTKVGAGDTAADDAGWQTKAKAEADRIGLEQYETGIRQITARSICDDVAAELAKDNTTWGLQGPRTSNNVRTDGLRHWKFTPPKDTK